MSEGRCCVRRSARRRPDARSVLSASTFFCFMDAQLRTDRTEAPASAKPRQTNRSTSSGTDAHRTGTKRRVGRRLGRIRASPKRSAPPAAFQIARRLPHLRVGPSRQLRSPSRRGTGRQVTPAPGKLPIEAERRRSVQEEVVPLYLHPGQAGAGDLPNYNRPALVLTSWPLHAPPHSRAVLC